MKINREHRVEIISTVGAILSATMSIVLIYVATGEKLHPDIAIFEVILAILFTILFIILGILKYEFGLRKTIVSLDAARKIISQAVKIYNTKRRHWSLDLDTPEIAHKKFNAHKYKNYSKNVA